MQSLISIDAIESEQVGNYEVILIFKRIEANGDAQVDTRVISINIIDSYQKIKTEDSGVQDDASNDNG